MSKTILVIAGAIRDENDLKRTLRNIESFKKRVPVCEIHIIDMVGDIGKNFLPLREHSEYYNFYNLSSEPTSDTKRRVHSLYCVLRAIGLDSIGYLFYLDSDCEFSNQVSESINMLGERKEKGKMFEISDWIGKYPAFSFTSYKHKPYSLLPKRVCKKFFAIPELFVRSFYEVIRVHYEAEFCFKGFSFLLTKWVESLSGFGMVKENGIN